MEFRFTVVRVLILLGLLVGFAWVGGFDPSAMAGARIARAWLYCVVLFVGGAVSATVIDHFVGTMEPTNLRIIYIVGGVIAMAGGSVWLLSMKQAIQGP